MVCYAMQYVRYAMACKRWTIIQRPIIPVCVSVQSIAYRCMAWARLPSVCASSHCWVMAIGYHHSPQDAPNLNHYPLIVQVADILSLICCYSDAMGGKDVEKIFQDFLPETASLWKKYNLNWEIENLGIWFEKLQQSRENDQGLLDIFTSS